MSANEEKPGTNRSMSRQANVFQRVGGHVQGKTLSGLVELVPLLVTIIVLWFINSYADQFVRPMGFVARKSWDVPGIGILTGIVVFYVVGLMISTRVGRKIMDWRDLETISNRIGLKGRTHRPFG